LAKPHPEHLSLSILYHTFVVKNLKKLHGALPRSLDRWAKSKATLGLGQIAFDRYRRLWQKQGVDLPRLAFHHGACYRLEPPLPALVVSYHPSRQNTQTGRLTEEMLDEVFARVRRLLDEV
jgi:uracil-DNA glycosylase